MRLREPTLLASSSSSGTCEPATELAACLSCCLLSLPSAGTGRAAPGSLQQLEAEQCRSAAAASAVPGAPTLQRPLLLLCGDAALCALRALPGVVTHSASAEAATLSNLPDCMTYRDSSYASHTFLQPLSAASVKLIAR